MKHLFSRIASARMRVLYEAGIMMVYRRQKMPDIKPYVVGTERHGRLILLEEFDSLADAKAWARENCHGTHETND